MFVFLSLAKVLSLRTPSVTPSVSPLCVMWETPLKCKDLILSKRKSAVNKSFIASRQGIKHKLPETIDRRECFRQTFPMGKSCLKIHLLNHRVSISHWALRGFFKTYSLIGKACRKRLTLFETITWQDSNNIYILCEKLCAIDRNNLIIEIYAQFVNRNLATFFDRGVNV